MPQNREKQGGKFEKGKSGNPGGRPKEVAEVRDLAREHTTQAIGTLVAIMNDKTEPGRARAAAAETILNRGWGKPMQPTEHSGPNGSAIPLKAEVAFVSANSPSTGS